jgi:hypothetical protein
VLLSGLSNFETWQTHGNWATLQSNTRDIVGIRIEITNRPANWNVYYRVHTAFNGWTGWFSNGAHAGWTHRIEAIQIAVMQGAIANSPEEALANALRTREESGYNARYDIKWDVGFGERTARNDTHRNRRLDYYRDGLATAFSSAQVRIHPQELARELWRSPADNCGANVDTQCPHGGGRPCLNQNVCNARHKNSGANWEALPSALNGIANAGVTGHVNCYWVEDENRCVPNSYLGWASARGTAITYDRSNDNTGNMDVHNHTRYVFVHEFVHMYDVGHCSNRCIMNIRLNDDVDVVTRMIICTSCRRGLTRGRRAYN